MANLNTAISPAPVVTCTNKAGQLASGYTGNVTMALVSNPTGATLSGTLTVAAVAGVATFSNLQLNRSGAGFRMRATGAAQGGNTPTAVTSNPFNIPTTLVFTTQPAGAAPGAVMPAVVVTARDSAGNTDTNYTGNVTIEIYSNPSGGPGTLSGTTTVAAVAGVATFSDLSIDAEGTYTFRATGGASS